MYIYFLNTFQVWLEVLEKGNIATVNSHTLSVRIYKLLY